MRLISEADRLKLRGMKELSLYVLLPFVAAVWFFELILPRYWPYCAVVAGLAILVGLWRTVRDRKRDRNRGWRIRHEGRDAVYYEELLAGKWLQIDLDGEMLCGKAHHAIRIEPAEKWTTYPDWARSRREEIVRRIKSECREPGYKCDDQQTA
jgi:hypothetical protein